MPTASQAHHLEPAHLLIWEEAEGGQSVLIRPQLLTENCACTGKTPGFCAY